MPDDFFQFDERGYLRSKKPVAARWEEVEQFFVEAIQKSETRKRLWLNFLEFTKRLQEEIAPIFIVWLDGSFVTEKLNPRDIDAVFMLDHRVCEQKKSILEQSWFNAENKQTKGLDLYYSIEYPKTHKRHFLTHLNHLYWLDIYGHTRIDTFGQKFTKGFVELKFG